MTAINIERNLKIDALKRTITVTKKFYTEASKYNSEAYLALEDITSKHPNYRLVIKKTGANKKSSKSGVTYEFMKAYIDRKGDTAKLETFKTKKQDGYNEVVEWFFEQYPEVEHFTKSEKNKAMKAA